MYTAGNFVADEIPTTTKWNYLWNNDASFADGTGISAGAINNSHIAAGALNVAKLNSPYKFSAYRSAAFTHGSPAVVPYDTELFDTSNNFDVVTNKGRFTAPVAGYYFFNGSAGVSASGSGYIAMLYKNGSPELQGDSEIYNGGSWGQNYTVSGLVQLAVSDYVEVYFYGSGQPADIGKNRTYFQGFLYSAL